MKPSSNNVPSAELVVNALIDYLDIHDTPLPWRLASQPTLRYMPWSTLYFVAVTNGQALKQLVVKIVRFPDQTSADISWQSEELLIRGRREFNSLQKVYNHFSTQANSQLKALHPEVYLANINAIVMDFVPGTPLYDNNLTARNLLSPRGRQRAYQALDRAGQWLRWFHQLPVNDAPSDRIFGPADALQALLGEVETLHGFDIHPERWPRWSLTVSILENVRHEQRVWTHGDFHLRNVFILPDDSVLSLDTALERVDSPFFDAGKFVADIKTRRARILSRGLLPPERLANTLSRTFIAGYLGGNPLEEPLPLLLYEGRFIFQKWVESLQTLQDAFSGKPAVLNAIIRKSIVNPTFFHILKKWMEAITSRDRN